MRVSALLVLQQQRLRNGLWQQAGHELLPQRRVQQQLPHPQRQRVLHAAVAVLQQLQPLRLPRQPVQLQPVQLQQQRRLCTKPRHKRLNYKLPERRVRPLVPLHLPDAHWR